MEWKDTFEGMFTAIHCEREAQFRLGFTCRCLMMSEGSDVVGLLTSLCIQPTFVFDRWRGINDSEPGV